jgi:plasmid stabilization system protein ParE
MRLTYLEEARDELLAAIAWYEECQPGLGHQFDREVQTAEDAILLHPEAWSKVDGNFRRKLLHRFPYAIIYHEPEPAWLEIVAIMHLHRQPDYWHSRQQGNE